MGFPNPMCDILRINIVPNQSDSWIWKGILLGLVYLKKHCFWELGNGENIDIWDDYRIPYVKPTENITRTRNVGVTKVCHLITTNKTWDLTKLAGCFDRITVDKITKIQIPNYGLADIPRWTLNNTDIFTVNSLYKNINYTGGINMQWNKIWEMKITPSIKNFIWKTAHSILPNSVRVAAIIPEIDVCCKLCNVDEESLTHLFMKCNFTKQVWMHLNFYIDNVMRSANTFHDWLNSWFTQRESENNTMEWKVFCSICNMACLEGKM